MLIHIYFLCINWTWRRASTRGQVSVSGVPRHLHCLPPHNGRGRQETCFLPLVGRKICSWHIRYTHTHTHTHIYRLVSFPMYIYRHQRDIFDTHLMYMTFYIWCMTLLVNILYVCSYTTLLVIIIYYVFVNVHDIIGYHFILYVCSCMTLN